MNNFYIELSGDTFLISITKSLRKTISMEVVAKYSIDVKAPLFIDQDSIKSFLKRKEKWLWEKNRTLIAFSNIIPDDISKPIIILGKPYTIGQDIKVSSTEKYKEEVEKWLKDFAREVIIAEVERSAKRIGVEYHRVFIRSQKTRWGSCSSRGNLNFNWKVILTTQECLKYLVIHELCHLIHMDHSRRFWDLVAKYDENFKDNRNMLQIYGPILRLK